MSATKPVLQAAIQQYAKQLRQLFRPLFFTGQML